MATKYYAGHSFQWMESFMKATQKHPYLHLTKAVCIAAAIHYQYVYGKQETFKLSHKALANFGVSRQYIRLYLQLFQQAGLIKFEIKKGRSPTITLILIPHNTIIKTNKHKINIKGTHVENDTGTCRE